MAEMALNHTLAADVPDHEIQTYIGEAGLADFYRRYETHFGEFVRADNPQEVDFDFVIGLSNFKETVKLRALLGIAISEKLDLGGLMAYGVTAKNNNQYRYDLKTSPHLIMPQ
jgi:hypothetical protein